MKNFLFLFLLFSLFLTTGCGNDDGDGPTNPGTCTTAAYGERILVTLTAFQEAATAYGTDPSTANCQAYKTSAQAYLDSLKEFETCALVADTQDYRDSLAEAEVEIANIPC